MHWYLNHLCNFFNLRYLHNCTLPRCTSNQEPTRGLAPLLPLSSPVSKVFGPLPVFSTCHSTSVRCRIAVRGYSSPDPSKLTFDPLSPPRLPVSLFMRVGLARTFTSTRPDWFLGTSSRPYFSSSRLRSVFSSDSLSRFHREVPGPVLPPPIVMMADPFFCDGSADFAPAVDGHPDLKTRKRGP